MNVCRVCTRIPGIETANAHTSISATFLWLLCVAVSVHAISRQTYDISQHYQIQPSYRPLVLYQHKYE